MAAVPHFLIWKDKAGEFRWRLVAPNSRITADSGEGYGSKEHCKRAIQTVKAEVLEAAVIDMSQS